MIWTCAETQASRKQVFFEKCDFFQLFCDFFQLFMLKIGGKLLVGKNWVGKNPTSLANLTDKWPFWLLLKSKMAERSFSLCANCVVIEEYLPFIRLMQHKLPADTGVTIEEIP